MQYAKHRRPRARDVSKKATASAKCTSFADVDAAAAADVSFPDSPPLSLFAASSSFTSRVGARESTW
jgi:hypothetical protein